MYGHIGIMKILIGEGVGINDAIGGLGSSLQTAAYS